MIKQKKNTTRARIGTHRGGDLEFQDMYECSSTFRVYSGNFVCEPERGITPSNNAVNSIKTAHHLGAERCFHVGFGVGDPANLPDYGI